MTLAAELVEHNLSAAVPAASARFAHVRLRNTGTAPWCAGAAAPRLALRVGRVVLGEAPLPCARVEPGDDAVFSFGWRAPEREGAVAAALELQAPPTGVLRRRPHAAFRIRLDLVVPDDDRTEQRMRTLFARGPWHWLPSGGVRLSRSGTRYPTLITAATGSRVRDEDGGEYVDWVMGWGACLLGYGEPRIVQAAAESLATTSLTTLPSTTETALADALCARLSGAEMVAFGKNGSDACTAAVRLARAFTGRDVVLHSGYHGWHDWCVERRGLTGAGVPAREPRLVHAFGYGDLAALDALLTAHGNRVACVMLEPSAQIGDVEGPIHATDPAFLEALAGRCRAAGALLVFDEIFTAFRHAAGSVQRATGVRPDLTCLGKALSNGMPLAAVVGRRDVFEQAMPRIAFDATFKGEPHALAAAARALEIYDEIDVPAHVERIGQQLADGIVARAGRHGVTARVVGPRTRMTVALPAAAGDGALARTLLQQELLQRGVLTFRGFMLPSAAHGAAELEHTLDAFDGAFGALAAAVRDGALLERLEIPLIE